MQCPNCGSRDIDFDEAGGHSACVNCGTVVEENSLTSSIEFQESGDRSSVIGQFVSSTASKPFSSAGSSRGRYGNNRDSREATLANARRIISQVAGNLRLPPSYVDRAFRYYQLALERNFIMGRRVIHVVATVLYTVCRQEKSPYLLIDFSDALQINVYVLGKSFLQFSRSCYLNIPIVDPSLYIHRFAARLELGDKVGTVIQTALRIITRLKKDWIATGRRPDGVCAVALLIASRCHGIHKTQAEVAKLFRISCGTLTKRLLDFRSSPSAQLTVEQFHLHDFDAEFDPPSFNKNKIKNNDDKEEESDDDDDAQEDDEEKPVKTKKVMINGVEVEVAILPGEKKTVTQTVSRINKSLARKALYDNIYSDISENATEESVEALKKEIEMIEQSGEDPGGWGSAKPHRVIKEGTSWAIDIPTTTTSSSSSSSSSFSAINQLKNDRKDDRNYKDNEEYPEEEIIEDKKKPVKVDNGVPFGEDDEDANAREVSAQDIEELLLDDDEQKKRSAIWEQNFRPFMDEREKRRKIRDEGELKDGKKRKKHMKRDLARDSASQAVFDGVQNKNASKKINYDALSGTFGEDGSFKLPTRDVVDPSLNVYGPNSKRNIKPIIDSSKTYPFAPLASTTSQMRLSLGDHDNKIGLGVKNNSIIPRKTISLTQKQKLPVPIVHKTEDDIPVKAGVKTGTVVNDPEKDNDDEDDMLMYDDAGDNNYHDDDDEEY